MCEAYGNTLIEEISCKTTIEIVLFMMIKQDKKTIVRLGQVYST